MHKSKFKNSLLSGLAASSLFILSVGAAFADNEATLTQYATQHGWAVADTNEHDTATLKKFFEDNGKGIPDGHILAHFMVLKLDDQVIVTCIDSDGNEFGSLTMPGELFAKALQLNGA